MELDLSQLENSIKDRLLRARLTAADDILLLTENELRNAANLFNYEIEIVCNLASETVLKSLPMSDNIKIEMLCSGCKNIDKLLNGGFVRGSGITEIAGESGSGKTQFCLQMSLIVQNSVLCGGFNKGAIYICTEDSFPSKRLQQLITNIQTPFEDFSNIPYGDQIYIEHVSDTTALKDCLQYRVQKLLDHDKIGLLVIDSIAAIFRADFSHNKMMERATQLRLIGNKLHHFASRYNLCIICVNQVTTIFSNDEPGGKLVPSLGLAWSNLVTTRIFLNRKPSCREREFEVVFSPHVAPGNCSFIITCNGISNT